MNKTIVGMVYLSLAASIWGSMFVVSKYVLEYITPMMLLWIRYVVAFFVLFSVLKFQERRTGKKKRINRKGWMQIAWIGFIGYFLSIFFQFYGTKLTDAHTGSLITSMTPVFVSIFAFFLLKESLTFSKVLSLLLATVGVGSIIGWQTEGDGLFLGGMSLVIAAISWALLSIYVKRASKDYSSLVITTYGIFFAIIFTTPFMIGDVVKEGMHVADVSVILGILYTGIVSTAGAFFLWNKGLEQIEASVGSLFLYFQPIVGTFFGWLILGEEIKPSFYFGGSLVFLAVFNVTISGMRHGRTVGKSIVEIE